ncbi:hypothetical protein DSO57_1039697 [Entomophthora muscae]|uniref:Uncharacterized protein n=1 Tax=Entomophthora muscae TaxID=34485 RepID=A0ACC2U9X7_9FUNG|nr:hypothetical protein DSO57_1039697 [Entomophthora muscae]
MKATLGSKIPPSQAMAAAVLAWLRKVSTQDQQVLYPLSQNHFFLVVHLHFLFSVSLIVFILRFVPLFRRFVGLKLQCTSLFLVLILVWAIYPHNFYLSLDLIYITLTVMYFLL